MPIALPTLRTGSYGEVVKTLQSALNLWPRSKLPPLATDGQFGSRTNSKVREFQSGNQLASDGVVGPLTWAQLEPLVKQIASVLPKADDEALGLRVVAAAEAALATLGWRESDTPSTANPRIAAALCAGDVGGMRMRQGGLALQQIMMIAEVGGMYPSRCPTITTDAEAWWQKQTKEGTDWRNAHDLCAWCGIFCIYVYRCAGINVPGGWSGHAKNVWSEAVFRRSASAKDVKRGSIGVVDGNGGRNHHFIVTENKDSELLSIDGNAFGPTAGDYSKGCKSVIARNRYSYEQLKKEGAYFLYPVAQIA
jgi:Putative peptidoglycan binding domain